MRIKISNESVQIFSFDLMQVGLLLSLCGGSSNSRWLGVSGAWSILLASLFIFVDGIRKKNYEIKYILAIAAILLFSLVSMTYAELWEHRGITNLMFFLEMPLLIISTQPLDNDRRIKSALFFAVIISFLYIYLYFSPRAYWRFSEEYGVIVSKDLTLGFSNPNETGMHLFACLSVLVSCVAFVKNKFSKILCLSLAAIILYFIVLTFSRACVVVGFVLALFSFPIAKMKNVPKILQKICFVFPIVFAVLAIRFQSFFETQVFMDDKLDTGRSVMYSERLQNLNFEEWFIGDYSYLFRNSHNAYISILLTIGSIGTILFLYIYYNFIKMGNKYASQNYNRVAFFALLLLTVHASVETATLVNGSIFAASFFSVYVIAIDCSKTVNNNSIEALDAEN